MTYRERIPLAALAVALFALIPTLAFAAAAGEAAQENIELNYWVGGYPTEGVEKLQELADSFYDETGIRVEVTSFPWGEYVAKHLSAIEIGSPPDIWEGGVTSYQVMGEVLAITDQFEGLPYKSALPPAYVNEITIDGERWGVPRIMTVWAIMVNREMFEAAGLDPDKPPEDWDELLQMAETLTRDTDNDGEIDQFGWGSHGGRLSSHQFLIWMYQQTGQNLTTKEGGFFLPQYRQEVINAIAHMNALAEFSPGGPEPSAAYQYADLLRLMAEEEIAMMTTTPYNARTVIGQNPALDGKIGFINLPLKPTGMSMAGGGHIAISSKSKHPEAAWRFIEFLQIPENAIPGTTLSRYIPARLDLIDDPRLHADPWASYMMQQAQQGVIKQEPHPGWGQLREKIFDAVAVTLLGEKTVEQAVDDMLAEMAVIQEAYK